MRSRSGIHGVPSPSGTGSPREDEAKVDRLGNGPDRGSNNDEARVGGYKGADGKAAPEQIDTVIEHLKEIRDTIADLAEEIKKVVNKST